MKKVIFWLCGILLLAVALGTGFFFLTREDEQEDGYRLYYLNGEEDALVTRSCIAEESDPTALVAELYLLEKETPALKKGEELKSLFMDGVELMNYSVQNELLTLNFSGAYAGMARDREILVRAGLTRLFTQIPGVKKIQFQVEGENLKNADGVEIGTLTAGRFVENSGKEINSYLKTPMTLYFADSTGTGLVREERNVYYNSNVPIEKVVVEQLVKGPKDAAHKPTLPGELNILSVTIQEGICYVNLDDGFKAMLELPTNVLNPEIAIYSIVNSLVEVCGVNKIQISVNGKTNIKVSYMDLGILFGEREDLVIEEQEE